MFEPRSESKCYNEWTVHTSTDSKLATRIALTSSSLRPSPLPSYSSKKAYQKSLLFEPTVGLDVLLDDVVLLEVVRLEQKGLRFEPTTILDVILDGEIFSLMLNALSKRGNKLCHNLIRFGFITNLSIMRAISDYTLAWTLYPGNSG